MHPAGAPSCGSCLRPFGSSPSEALSQGPLVGGGALSTRALVWGTLDPVRGVRWVYGEFLTATPGSWLQVQ